MDNEIEVFKISKKSICHECSNINEVCNMKVSMTCGTDGPAGLAFVQRCGSLNKVIQGRPEESSHTITADHKPESRVDMMGGGHNLD